MYIIIDTTTGKVWKHEGNNPIDIIDRIVNKGCTPIVENDTTEDTILLINTSNDTEV